MVKPRSVNENNRMYVAGMINSSGSKFICGGLPIVAHEASAVPTSSTFDELQSVIVINGLECLGKKFLLYFYQPP